MPDRLQRFLPAFCAIVLGVGHFFYYQQNMLASPYHINDDVVQHYLWLFDTDWADDFYARTSGQIQPWGFRGLLSFLGLFTDPVTISRYGPLLLTVLITTFATGLLRKFFPLVLALAGAYLIAQDTIDTGLGFLARGFSTPLLLIFAYFLVRRNPWGIAGAMVAAALFYPPVLLINGFILLAFMLAWLARRPWRKENWSIQPYAILVVGTLLAGLLTLIQAYLIQHSPDLGAPFPQADLQHMAEFSGTGRVPFRNITDTPTGWMTHYFMRLLVGTWPAPNFGYFLLAAAAVLGLLTVRRTASLAGYLLLFLLVTIGLYHLAKVVTPSLFLADRYLQYPWRMGVPLLFTFLGGCLWALHPKWWVAVPIAIGIVYVGYLRNVAQELPLISLANQAPIYDALRQLPEDALIVAPPQWASFIPLMAQRAVLLGHEQAHALYFQHYYDYITPRYRDYQDAMTADSLQNIVAFLDKYQVDYLLLDRNFLGNGEWHYFSPYHSRFRELIRDRPREDFALLRIPDSLGTTFDESLQLISRPQLDSLVSRGR